MALMLLLSGIGALGAFALHTVAAQQAADASVLHVYLRDDAPPTQVDDLKGVLMSNSEVTAVAFISKEDALRRARSRPGMSDLLAEAAENPLPASFDVRVRQLSGMAALSRLAAASPAVDSLHPTSYDPGLYDQLQRLLALIRLIGFGVIAVLGLVSFAVTASAIRAAAVSRRAESRTMHLVGASAWMVGAPFVVEGAVTGAAGAAVAALLIVAMQHGVAASSGDNFSALLPGVSTDITIAAAIGLLPLGILLGSLSSVPALRGRRP